MYLASQHKHDSQSTCKFTVCNIRLEMLELRGKPELLPDLGIAQTLPVIGHSSQNIDDVK